MMPNGMLELEARMKSVLRFMPAPVGVVTSYDVQKNNAPVGLAMSAMMPVSLDPCAMAISINRSSASHGVLLKAGRFCINLLSPGQVEHLEPFATPAGRDARFTHLCWKQRDSMWFIDAAPANIFCEVRESISFGTHDILVGQVYDLSTTGNRDILGWADGAVCRASRLSA